MNKIIGVLMIYICIFSFSCLAAMPKTFNYQGKLLNVTTKTPITSAMLMTFLIYDNATTGSPLWQEEQLVSPDANGIISVVLGNTTPINLNFTKQFWLAIEAPTGAPNALWPRRQLTSAPYAFSSINGVPVGTVLPFAGDVFPADYLECNGQSVLKADYPDLWDVIGYTYGGATTSFNVPNYSGRVPVGKNVSDPNFDTLGDLTGEATHVLSTWEMPSHRHVPNHTLILGNKDNAPGTNANVALGDAAYGQQPYTFEGNDRPHNNIQPSIVVNYIIRAK